MSFDSFNADFVFVFVIARSQTLVTHECHPIGNVDGSGSIHSESISITVSLALSLSFPDSHSLSRATRAPPDIEPSSPSRLYGRRWNSKSVARITEQVMLIEERRLDVVRKKAQTSEHCRIRLSSAEFDVKSGKLLLKSRRFPY
jgi:hypothetical protein